MSASTEQRADAAPDPPADAEADVLCSVEAARYSPQARLSEVAVRGESVAARAE